MENRMKLLLLISVLLGSLPLLADVFIDPRIRPCDEQLAAKLRYTPTPVWAPGTPKLPFTCDGDVKVFQITAEEVMSVFDKTYEPGPIYTWGYNGSNPGPVMEIIQGEKIRVIFKNKLPESTTLHWHGLEVPYNQDGAAGHSQNPVKPGEGFIYEWTAEQAGTFMYHSSTNLSKQLSMGLVSFLIVHPEKTPETLVDHDILFFLQMWALPPHSIYPDVMEMLMFNYFTMNGLSSPDIPSPTIFLGQKVRLRFANMSMMEHPVHLHGHTWRVVATGGGDNPRSAHTTGNTILVPTAQTMDVIIDEVDTPGEWMMHCHLPHHVTNNMDIDIIPGEPMFMGNGGMHTVLKVFKGPNDPGYQNPTPPEGGTTGGGHDHGGGHGDMPAPQITTYDGQIKLSSGLRLDVTLELFKAQEDKEWRKLKAFLKVYLSQDEFLVYEYEQVKYNFETGMMSLESDETSITLSNLAYMDHGDMGMLSGEASVDFGLIKGSIQLETRDPEMNSIRLKTNLSITGEYTGTCAGKPCFLQLLTARDFKNDEGNLNNPLARFAITGSLGIQNGPQVLVDAIVKEAYYDPFRSELSLKMDYAGIIKSFTCKPTIRSNKINGIDCGDIKFERVNSLTSNIEPAIGQKVKFLPDTSPKLSELSPATELAGSFNGGLVIGSSNTVLPMAIKIVSKRYATNSMVITKNMISGVAELMMGSSSLSFKLKERPFLDSSSSINNNKNLLLFESNSKLSIVINQWTKTSISGEAYHSSYGQIGRFQANRDAQKLPLDATEQPTMLPVVDGNYQGADWKLSLSSSVYEEGSSSNVYAPLHFKGTLKKGTTGPLINIINGTYDFILGVINLETDDGRILKGFVNQGELELLLPSKPLRRSKYLNLNNSRTILRRIN